MKTPRIDTVQAKDCYDPADYVLVHRDLLPTPEANKPPQWRCTCCREPYPNHHVYCGFDYTPHGFVDQSLHDDLTCHECGMAAAHPLHKQSATDPGEKS
jgi:hypothetical protein